MKGIVFTEFFEMVEKVFGYEMVDQLIEETDLKSEGAYTMVGTYDFNEMEMLVGKLSEKSGLSEQSLLYEFGKYIFDTFVTNYPTFFDIHKSTFSFLNSIENHIHVEVKKLYSDAELPYFESQYSEDQMELYYSSTRRMGSFALGLIEKSLEHYDEKCSVDVENLKDDGSHVKFTLRKIT